MANLRIRVFKGAGKEPATTITIPTGILKFASKLLPQQAVATLQEKGIDLDAVVELSQNPEARGILVEIEDHEKNQRVVIAME